MDLFSYFRGHFFPTVDVFSVAVFSVDFFSNTISPIVFNLYSEYMMKVRQDNRKRIIIGGKNYTYLRYADDAVRAYKL